MRKMYSENQIKKLVNDGIESGEIQVPGGTKLYHHSLRIESDYTYNISVISTQEEPYITPTDSALELQLCYQGVINIFDDDQVKAISYVDLEAGDTGYIYYANGDTASVSNLASVSDEVTSL